ncbi:MAG TPA: DUF5666 domain-containing protein [Candidatus Dormibacteraeota bacterium]|nr:DUF5666 domain-containing protein [Candidatus Dormibacteraeota bacterium]
MQTIPRQIRVAVTTGLLLTLAVAALMAGWALTHTGRDRSVALVLPARHAGFQPGAGHMGPRGGTGAIRGGAGGTITQINGGTLTLRTEEGTQTVNTSGSTTYMKDRQTIALSDLKVGDVVHVVPDANTPRPATPGTGTVSASRIVVVEPMLGGRVTSIDGDTVNLVGRDGRELTVTLGGDTKYFNGMQSADRSAVTVGSHIVAAGSQDSLTHLTASVITVVPKGAGGAAPMWRGGGHHPDGGRFAGPNGGGGAGFGGGFGRGFGA